jgi:PKD repeat protein
MEPHRPVDVVGFVTDNRGPPDFHWTASPVDNVDPGASCAFDPPNALITTVACTDDGIYAIHLSANDGSNDTVTDTARLTLWNTAPTLGPPPTAPTGVRSASTRTADDGFESPEPWQVFRVDDPVPLTTRFRDQGSNDTHTCAIRWDDGSTETVQAEDHTCTASHAFAEPGMYTIQSTVRDDDEDSITGSVMVIVYDPDGGFATSGAYLDSPAGALPSAPDAAGRLHVRLNPKYKPGDPGPAVSGGKVSARLSTAFSLNSTSLDWLVVTPRGTVAVKGSATVNGESGYGYVACGYDDPDKLRLVVWPLSEGSYPGTPVTYDNRAGSDYDLDLANPQELSGGSFQAHL